MQTPNFRDRQLIKGLVEIEIRNPGKAPVRIVKENIVNKNMLSACTLHLIAGAADTLMAVEELHLGDATTAPTVNDTGVGNEIHSAGVLTDATGLTATQVTTTTANDTLQITNTWGPTAGSAEDVSEVAAMTGSGALCMGHAVFSDPAQTIAIGGTLSITYKFIFAPA